MHKIVRIHTGCIKLFEYIHISRQNHIVCETLPCCLRFSFSLSARHLCCCWRKGPSPCCLRFRKRAPRCSRRKMSIVDHTCLRSTSLISSTLILKDSSLYPTCPRLRKLNMPPCPRHPDLLCLSRPRHPNSFYRLFINLLADTSSNSCYRLSIHPSGGCQFEFLLSPLH